MDPVIVISILVGLILILLIVGAPIKPIRFFGQAIVKMVVGLLFLFFLNAFGSLFDYQIPINFVTASTAGLLGVPGIALLVAIDYFIL